MKKLKAMGYTNRDISLHIDNGWSESPIKTIHRGTRVIDTTQRDKALKLLSELVDRGLTLDDVEEIFTIHDELRDK